MACHVFIVLSFLALVSNGVCGFGRSTRLHLQRKLTIYEKSETTWELKRSGASSWTDGSSEERRRATLTADAMWVRSLQWRMKNGIHGNKEYADEEDEIPVYSGTKLEILNYVVTVELGNQTRTVIVDTGSDLTWIQCTPCTLCYTQHDPLFDPVRSPSYRAIPCNSSSCKSLPGNEIRGECNAGKDCEYILTYGDGSYSSGQLAADQLLLGETSIDSFIFGCGRENKGIFGGTSGLIGLGRGSFSFISQTSGIFGGVFSYCLPSTEEDGAGSLTFGNDGALYRNTTPFLYAKMVENNALPGRYFVNLTGIMVGGVAVESSGQTAFLIDSGTVITRLQPSVYAGLKREFSKQFSSFPPAPAYSILDTCFNLSLRQGELEIPTVTLQFDGGAAVNVVASGVLYMVQSDSSQSCLAFASLSSESQVAIIGNYQQKDLRIVYNNHESVLGFARETCDLGS